MGIIKRVLKHLALFIFGVIWTGMIGFVIYELTKEPTGAFGVAMFGLVGLIGVGAILASLAPRTFNNKKDEESKALGGKG